MQIIHLQQTLPQVFADGLPSPSDVWTQDVILKRGEIYLIEAASGTGKTSLCSFLYGARHDYNGQICFDDTDIATLSTAQWVDIRRQHLAYLFQDMRLFSELTAWENVLLKRQMTQYTDETTIKTRFDQLGIADKMSAKAGLLSFGQQQRVAFIRALCQPFDFILLDEPVSHLDDKHAQAMADILTEEVQRQGAGVIATSIGKQLPLPYQHQLQL